MLKTHCIAALAATALIAACTTPQADTNAEVSKENASSDEVSTMEKTELCVLDGPQTPRDISSKTGLNTRAFTMAPAATQMNLCNIHTHTNAEHKGPGFSVFVNDSDYGGYACNDTASLTAEQLRDPANGKGAYGKVKPGDTIEVHWVHTSCDTTPGEGLGQCVPDTCKSPVLRVEAQVFLVVNDKTALDFNDFVYAGTPAPGAKHQAKKIPSNTGTPVVFRGSTTGPSYDQVTCSKVEATWSVRPMCARVDISSLNRWAEKGNIFNEKQSHGVRQLVTAPELLSPIE